MGNYFENQYNLPIWVLSSMNNDYLPPTLQIGHYTPGLPVALPFPVGRSNPHSLRKGGAAITPVLQTRPEETVIHHEGSLAQVCVLRHYTTCFINWQSLYRDYKGNYTSILSTSHREKEFWNETEGILEYHILVEKGFYFWREKN